MDPMIPFAAGKNNNLWNFFYGQVEQIEKIFSAAGYSLWFNARGAGAAPGMMPLFFLFLNIGMGRIRELGCGEGDGGEGGVTTCSFFLFLRREPRAYVGPEA